MIHGPTRWLLVATLLVAPAACHRNSQMSTPSNGGSGAEADVPALTVADVAAKIARHEPIAIFDANSQSQYQDAHVPGARWIAYQHMQATDLPSDHGTPLVFYCHNEA